MPARFPDKTVVAKPKTGESQSKPDATPSCRLLIAKPGGRNVWALGSRYVLKNREYYPGSEIETANTSLAEESSGVLVPKMVAAWKEEDRYFTIQDRIEGESLEEALPKLTQEDIARIGQQVGKQLLRLRGTVSGTMQMLDGRPVIDRRLCKPLPASSSGAYSVCVTDEDVRANLSLAIAHRVDKSTLNDLMAKMPSALPFTFSHSDVHEGNIMVKGGNFVGLIDWELAGFYPCWWEFVNSCELLSDHLPATLQDHSALEWFRVYHGIRERPEE
ncbi:kinase-like protein [Hypoxylon crocopeplum]|nr:kinase-like protein [Hypoxylon crocopeplum]